MQPEVASALCAAVPGSPKIAIVAQLELLSVRRRADRRDCGTVGCYNIAPERLTALQELSRRPHAV